MESYPVSLGTAPIISKLASGDIIKEKYPTVYISAYTIIRNVYSALSKSERQEYDDRAILDIILSELEAAHGAIIDTGYLIQYYFVEYPEIGDKSPRMTNTRLILREYYTALLEYAKSGNLQVPSLLVKGKLDIGVGGIIVTHVAYDLLLITNRDDCFLLESFTGNQKYPSTWSSKLLNCKLSSMPFNKISLIIYGDGEIYKSANPKVRDAFDKLALEYNWTPNTTVDRIKLNISLSSDKELIEEYINVAI